MTAGTANTTFRYSFSYYMSPTRLLPTGTANTTFRYSFFLFLCPPHTSSRTPLPSSVCK
jgi:hypothetical protein